MLVVMNTTIIFGDNERAKLVVLGVAEKSLAEFGKKTGLTG